MFRSSTNDGDASDLASLIQRFDNLERVYGNIAPRNATVESRQTAADQTVAAMHQNHTTVEAKLSELNQTFAKMTIDHTTVASKLADPHGRTNRLEVKAGLKEAPGEQAPASKPLPAPAPPGTAMASHRGKDFAMAQTVHKPASPSSDASSAHWDVDAVETAEAMQKQAMAKEDYGMNTSNAMTVATEALNMFVLFDRSAP